MNKIRLCATYNGQCYINGYGRARYQKGVELIDVKECNGNVVIPKMRKAITKALEQCLNLISGTKVEFEAVLDGNDVSYISNVKVVG